MVFDGRVCAFGSRLNEAFMRSARFTIEQLFGLVSLCSRCQSADIGKSTNRSSLHSGHHFALVSRARGSY